MAGPMGAAGAAWLATWALQALHSWPHGRCRRSAAAAAVAAAAVAGWGPV